MIDSILLQYLIIRIDSRRCIQFSTVLVLCANPQMAGAGGLARLQWLGKRRQGGAAEGDTDWQSLGRGPPLTAPSAAAPQGALLPKEARQRARRRPRGSLAVHPRGAILEVGVPSKAIGRTLSKSFKVPDFRVRHPHRHPHGHPQRGAALHPPRGHRGLREAGTPKLGGCPEEGHALAVAARPRGEGRRGCCCVGCPSAGQISG